MKLYNRSLIARAREMRTQMTRAEKTLWFNSLRSMPFKFRRQRPMGPYIVDFYCPSKKTVVEVDGDSHFSVEAEEYDQARTKFLNEQGIRVIRITNTEVFNNLEGVHQHILAMLGEAE